MLSPLIGFECNIFLVVSIRIYDIKNASSSRSGTILSQLKIIVDKMKPLHEMIRSENARTMDEIDFKNKFTARLDEAYNYLRDLKQKSDFFTSVHPQRRPSGKRIGGPMRTNYCF